MTRSEMKAAARESMRTATPSVILTALIYLAVANVLSLVVGLVVEDPFSLYLNLVYDSYPPNYALAYAFSQVNLPLYLFLNLVVVLFTSVLQFGYVFCMMRAARRLPYSYGGLISQFYQAGRIILLLILQTVFLYLWSLLFVIPGIIAAYRYRQAVYLLLDHPDWSPLRCIRESKRMMQGYKMELFVLDLSFLGWALLLALGGGLLGVGAGFVLAWMPVAASIVSTVISVALNLWLMPYMDLTYVIYYDQHPGRPPLPGEEEPWRQEGRYDTDDPWK